LIAQASNRVCHFAPSQFANSHEIARASRCIPNDGLEREFSFFN
jgi:hypothetical protein